MGTKTAEQEEAERLEHIRKWDEERKQEEALLKTMTHMERLTYEVWQNLPEAVGVGGGFECTDFHYPALKPKEWCFEFTDFEDKGQVVKVNWDQAVDATTKFFKDLVFNSKFHFEGMHDPMDAGCYDGYVVYTLVQYAIYGEAIYG